MLDDLRQSLGLIDRPHLPRPGTPGREAFKEWFHFTLLDAAQGIDVIANLSLAGDVTRAGAARADIIALAHLAGRGWSGAIDTYEATAADIDHDRLAIRLAHNRVHYADGVYRLSLRLQDEVFDLELQMQPRTEPLLVWNDTPLGSGKLNWLILPQLDASGRLSLVDGTRLFDRVPAYHDHNWGYWKWGDDFGWEWGFVIDAPATAGAPQIAVVFDRTTDRIGGEVLEQTLGVWRNGSIAKLFTRQMLRARRIGRFEGRIPRLPGAASLIQPGQVLEIPSVYRISARDAADWLDIDYRIDAGLQVSVPTDFGFGLVGLNETLGNCQVRGEVGGRSYDFTARACFEFMS
jgi:hypothetical protein